MKKIIVLIICVFTLFSLNVSASVSYVVDNDDLFTPSQEQLLEDKIEDIRAKHDFDIVILTFDDLQGKDIEEYSADYFYDNGFGVGPSRDGLIFSVYNGRDKQTRMFASLGHGIGEVATGESFYSALFDQCDVVDLLSDNRFFDASIEYLDFADERLEDYSNGNIDSFSESEFTREIDLQTVLILFAVALGIPLLTGWIYVSVLKSKMRPVKAGALAHEYIKGDSFRLTRCVDFFLYSNVTRVRIKSNTSSSSGRSSGGSSFRGGSSRF